MVEAVSLEVSTGGDIDKTVHKTKEFIDAVALIANGKTDNCKARMKVTIVFDVLRTEITAKEIDAELERRGVTFTGETTYFD